MKALQYENPGKHGKLRILADILLFGSVWGVLEATLGGYLHMIIFPNKGAIMSGIGVAIMASALAIYKKPGMLPGIGIVAALFKLLDVWLFALPVISIHIINPAMAIIFESLAFGLIAIFAAKKIVKNAFVGVGVGVLVGFISAIAWVYFAIYVMNAPAYARVVFKAGEFIANQGVIQAVFSGTFFPLGYMVGDKLRNKTILSSLGRSQLYYVTSAAVIACCWVIAALTVKGGF